ncbi:unnamed protein product [Heligmosomoides polygyrus]|uniref:Btz domain-containing protein n=1 Tax=Heligmosomoides polygyrus TaxID=6339 RepID=A0A3P8AXS9_HELPZ|nr:unnamed protein product [Heligmosomoides polygyrus]
MRGSGSPPTKAPPALVVSRPMMTMQVILLQLFVHCLLAQSLDSYRHGCPGVTWIAQKKNEKLFHLGSSNLVARAERRRSFIDTAPKYSRLTPYQDEESFPQPVYGMAHGFPYGSHNKEFDKEFFKNYPSAAEGGDSSGDEHPPDSREHPRSESRPAVEHHRPRKPGPPKEVELPHTEHQSNERHPEKGPPLRPTRWKGAPGRSSERKTARDSEELRPPGLRRRWRGGLHPRPTAGRSSSEEEHGSREKPRSPNGSSESAPGVGFDSRHSDGRDSGGFGAADRRDSHEGKERAGLRTTTAGKIVGVDMQMVAGMYPKDQSSPYPGRFSPLSGPFSEEQEESEAERFTSQEGRREPWRRVRQQNRSRKYSKDMDKRYGGYGVGGNTRRRSYFGEFDAYFEPIESPRFDRTTDHSSQERAESILKPQASG